MKRMMRVCLVYFLAFFLVCGKLCYGGGSQDVFLAQEQQEQVQEQNPYVFEDRHFTTRLQTQHGRVRILQNFAERSRLHLGIANYRVSVLEAQPQTFVLPTHWDAEAYFYVSQGQGTVTLVSEDNRESFNIRQGDVFRVAPGTTNYLINRHNRQRLVIYKLINPVAVPGYYEAFFAPGGQNPQSFLTVFSNEILQAALNTNPEKYERVFRQEGGAIVKANEEQIRALSQQKEEGRQGSSSSRPEWRGIVNIFEQRPTRSNQYGQLYEVNPERHRQLRVQDVSSPDIAVTLANITQGAMIAPHYNSKATKVAIVADGEGYLELVSPHLSSQQERPGGSQQQQQQQGRGPSYQKVSAPLRRGTVVIVPAGHPFTAVASNNQNLQLVFFEINARNNQRYPLAGKSNIINQFQREAKELAFGVSAREVDEVFTKQNEEFFFAGPSQHGRAEA